MNARSSSTEDRGPPQKRQRLDSADSLLLQPFTDDSTCLSEINQKVLDQSEKEKNIFESSTSVDKQEIKDLKLSLEASREPPSQLAEAECPISKEITEIKLKNMQLSRETVHLNERMIHQAAEHESEHIVAEKKIIDLQAKLKTILSSIEDIDFIKIQLGRAKAVIEKLAVQNTSLLEQNQQLLSKAARARALEEDMKSPRCSAALQEGAETQGQFCENAEYLQQQVTVLKGKCAELTSKVIGYVKPAAAKGEDHNLVQDSSLDKITPDANEDDEPLLQGKVEDDVDGRVEDVAEMEQGEDVAGMEQEEENRNLSIQEESLVKSIGDALKVIVKKVDEMERGKQNLHHPIQDESSDNSTPGANDEPSECVKDDLDATVEMEQAEQNRHHLIQDSSSDKLIPVANDEDESSSGESGEDDADDTVELDVAEMEKEKGNHHHLIQDSSSDKLNPDADADDEDESSSEESVGDDLDGTVERVAEMDQTEQNRNLSQNSNSGKVTPDGNYEDDSSSEESVESVAETKQREQNFRIKIGKHIYLVSNSQYSEINWNKEYDRLGTQYVCKRCRKQSANLHYIQDHIWSYHYGERYECVHCGDHSKAYSFRTTLQKHMHRDHPMLCRCIK